MLDKSYPDFLPISESQADIAYDVLMAAILNCDLSPGQKVSESELAKRFDVGKGPVRVALARLRQQGLVTVVARRGYQIAPVTLRNVKDVFELRRLLEPAAARMAAGRVDVEHLARLDAVCAAGYDNENPQGIATFLQAHRQIHLNIASATGNRRLLKTLTSLWDETNRYFHLSGLLSRRVAELRHDHQNLISVLGKGDGEEAEHIVRAEIDGHYSLLTDEFLSSDSAISPTAFANKTAAELSLSE